MESKKVPAYVRDYLDLAIEKALIYVNPISEEEITTIKAEIHYDLKTDEWIEKGEEGERADKATQGDYR